jgi:transglutaminase-like putative cysteine protease
MIRFLLLSILFIAFLVGFSNDYAVDRIPESLKKKANAVIRKSVQVLDIKNDGLAILNSKKVVTVMNRNGDSHALFYAFYDKYRQVSNIVITLFDKNGDRTDRIKASDLRDVSAVSGFSLYEDNRLIYYEPHVTTYPYTIEINYQIEFNGYLGFQDWYPRYSSDVSIEYGMYKVITKDDNDIKFLENNILGTRNHNENSSELVYVWQVSNQEAYYSESFSPPLQMIFPNVQIAPIHFNYGGEKGSMESWNQFGKWIGKLMKGRNDVSAELSLKIKKLTEDAGDTTEMVKRIYEFVQVNTRYVSIQMGVGGYQPFKASSVEENGYGDCKALSNYTMTLLEEAGIRSNYSLVRAGSNMADIYTDFPSQQFNHAILCVPQIEDTIWLECTNQNIPFNFLGSFTGDRHVLSIDKNGGKLIKTPAYSKEHNIEKCKFSFEIDEFANGMGAIDLVYLGLAYDEVFGFINEDREEQKKWLYEHVDLPGLKINDFVVTERKDKFPEAYVNIQIDIQKYASVSGKRMFVPLIPVEKLSNIPSDDEDRKFDIYLNQAKMYYDSISISLPENYNLEYLPQEVNLANQFGEYHLMVTQEGQNVIAERTLSINKGTFPKSNYHEFVAFYQAIQKNDNSKLVLKKKE